jgi:xylulokinase
LEHLLNLPGNFTAAKLRWVRENEPDVYRRIHKIMLPGDYIALRLTGEAATTVTGLSEGVFWDFKTDTPSQRLLEQLQIDPALLSHVAPNFEVQGRTHAAAAADTGLRTGIPVTYRAGDQPNNALALNVLDPGEVAATGGTSGVVYGVLDRLAADPLNRVNSFAHINHRAAAPRIGVLLCINGSGILYNWLRQQVAAEGATYPDLERLAATVPPGSDGLCVLPFGNGAERMLGNRNPGAQIANLHFNRHQRAHLFRAGLEGIAFSFVYGMKVLSDLGLNLSVIRVGNDNLFQSNIFAHTIAQLTGARIEVLRTTGAVGAAIASGVGVGLWPDVRTGLGALESLYTVEPSAAPESLLSTYERWERLV